MIKHVLFILIFCLSILKLSAQPPSCPPPGFPEPGNTCNTAPILCPDLDGYCATINNSNTQQTFPGCPGFALNNDEWFAFFAGSTTISMTITPSNCSPGGNQGLQGGIYRNCVSAPIDLQCSCTTNPFVLQGNNFIVGQIYYIVLDGCAGNVCDYSVDVTQGSTVSFPPNPAGPISGPTTICAGTTQNFSIAAIPAASTYVWTLDPPVGTVTSNGVNATVNIPANATTENTQLCVVAGNACYPNTMPSCIDIEIIPRPTAVISGSGAICAGTTGNVELTVTFTGEGPWTFTPIRNGSAQAPITTSDNPYTYTVTQPGTYTISNLTATGSNCLGTVSGSAVVTTITLTATTTSVGSTCGLPNGSANLTVSGGTAPYTFEWSNGETTEDISMIVGGMTYTVTVTSTEGCTRTATVNVPNTNPTFTITPTITPNTSCNTGNGAISVNVTPSASYTYEWSNSETTNAITGLPPGPYTVTVNGGGQCTQTATFNVPNNPNNPSASLTQTGSTCSLDNGSVNLTVSGGVTPYTFEWSNNETTEDITGVPSGPYSVTVTGANGCTTSTSVNVTNTNPPFTVAQAVVANTTCNGGNGSVTLTPAPASGTYTYAWDNGETTASLTGLTPGSYPVTVSAGGSCTTTLNVNIADQPSLPTVTGTPVATTCELPNGSINLNVSGGVAPYTFLWDNGEVTQNLTGIAAGPYSVVVTGANGCTREITVNVSNTNPPININSTVVQNTTCNGGNGSITLTVTPASPVYTYLWEEGQTTSTITGLEPGSYSVTVQGNGSCTQTATINVNDNPSLPNVTSTTVSSTCELPNGSINLNVTGGVAPYTFLWDNGSTTQNLNGITSGSYEVAVTGANGCSRVVIVNVNNNDINFNVNVNDQPNTTCNSNPNGSIALSVTPGGNTYTYLWSNTATTSSISNLPAGTYEVTISAGGSCTEIQTIDITDEPNEPQLNHSVIDARCGQSNGSINLSVSGGVAPFVYDWSSGQNVQDIFNLLPGEYIVTVTGANGCSAIEVVTVEDNPINININGNETDNTSCATPNGSITISVSPSTGTTVLWSTNQTTNTISNLAPGDYSVTVTIGSTCEEVAEFTIFDNSEDPELSVEVTDAICGLANGAINLSVDGGATPYTYLWSNNATTQDLTNRPAGTYTVTVTTVRGCTSVLEATIIDFDPGLSVLGTVFENTSCANPNGTIYTTVIPEGYNFTYAWSTSSSQPNLLNVGTGIYTVTVTLGYCTTSEVIEMTTNAAPPIPAIVGTAATCGLSNGSATASATGGVTPYVYKWSNTANGASINNVPPGVYTVTVTGANGCSASTTVTIANNSIPINIAGTVTDNTSCVASNGGISLNITPAGTYTYAWSNLATTPTLTNLSDGTYTVTVTSGPTCSASATFVVLNSTSDPVISAVVEPDICSQGIGGVNLTLTGGGGTYTYTWSNMSANEDISGVNAGAYTVTVVGNNGCTATEVFTIPNNSNTFSLAGSATPLTNCATNNGAVNLTITPVGAYQILWNTTSTTEDLAGLTAGSYTVTVTQSGSCTASLTFVVADERVYPALNNTVTAEICGLGNGAAQVNTNGGTAPFTYLWSSGQNTEDLTNINAGNYILTVTDANACTATTSLTVADNPIVFTINGTTAPNTSCGVNNGAVDINISPFGNYTFLWSNNGVVSEDLTNIDGGTYTVTVSAGGTCTNIATFDVIDNTLSPVVTNNITAAFCARANGGVTLNVSGSAAPYQYFWSTNATTSTLSGVAAGSYTVTVTGANACTTEATVTIPDDAFTPVIAGTAAENNSCTAPNGSISVTVTPADTYTFTWETGQNTANITGLTAGTYTVTVSAGGNCTAETNFSVNNNTQSPTLSNVVAPSICSQPNGNINLSVSGGIAPFTYFWSTNATTEDIAGLLSGDYEVTVTGSNGCTATGSYSVGNESNNFAVSEIITPNSSCNSGNGSINVSVTPVATYTFLWSNNANTEDLSNLFPDTYTVTVTDATGCSVSTTFVVAEEIIPVTLSGNTTDVLCFGNATGAIDLTVDTGSPGYTYNWQPAQPGNLQDLNNIASGEYKLTVTDAKGCTSAVAFTITQPAAASTLNCDQSQTVSAPGLVDGEGTVGISGGTPPYEIAWSPGSTSSNLQPGDFVISNLAEGSYSVTVTDANGCPTQCGFNIGLVDCETEIGTMSTALITRCGPLCATATYNSAGQVLDGDDVLQFILHEGNSNSIVNEIARNTQPTFCFDATTMTYGTTYYISAVAGTNDGTGNVVLSDFCTVVAFGTPVLFNEKPEVSVAAPLALSCANEQISLSASSSMANTAFEWTTGTGTISGPTNVQNIQVTEAGNYRVIATVAGCKDTVSVVVNDITNAPQANITADPSDILDCKIDQIILSGNIEGTSNANIIWLSGGNVYSNNNPVQITDPGTYEFIVLDTITACADTAIVTINENSAFPPLNVLNPALITCAQPTAVLTGSSPFPGIILKWVRITGTDTILVSNSGIASVSQAGTYYLIGIDPVNTCTNIISTTVNADQTLPTADAGTPFTIDCFGETVPLSGFASGTTANIALAWSTSNGNIQSGSSTLTPIITLPGTYTLLVTDNINGCTASDDVVIPPDAPVATLDVVQPPCFGDKGRIEVTSVTGGAPPVRYAMNGGPLTTNNVFPNLSEGTYTLLIQDAQGCTTTAAATIDEPVAFEISVIPDVLIQIADSFLIQVSLSVPASEVASVQWTPSETLSCDTCLVTMAKPLKTSEYEVVATNQNGCEDRASIEIRVDTRLNIYVPNIFTPDTDGENKWFTIYADPTKGLKIKTFQIYSRWGEKVFERANFDPNIPNLGWDGTLNGKLLNPAVFVWYAVIIGPAGDEILLEGDVTLMH